MDEFDRHGFDITNGQHCHYWLLCADAWLEDSTEYKRLLAVQKLAELREQAQPKGKK